LSGWHEPCPLHVVEALQFDIVGNVSVTVPETPLQYGCSTVHARTTTPAPCTVVVMFDANVIWPDPRTTDHDPVTVPSLTTALTLVTEVFTVRPGPTSTDGVATRWITAVDVDAVFSCRTVHVNAVYPTPKFVTVVFSAAGSMITAPFVLFVVHTAAPDVYDA
jgi:hypothetical protein